MDSTLIQILVKDVAVPELLKLLSARREITEGDMVIVLSNDVEKVKAVGQAFLDQTRPPA